VPTPGIKKKNRWFGRLEPLLTYIKEDACHDFNDRHLK
jgi:hypothetical protein